MGISRQDILAICEELWKSQYLEEALVACIFTESLKKQFEPSDFKAFERWVNKFVSNWASCDTLCNHTVGTFIMMYPEYLTELKKWARSSNRWTKRASAVTLIIPTDLPCVRYQKRNVSTINHFLSHTDGSLTSPND